PSPQERGQKRAAPGGPPSSRLHARGSVTNAQTGAEAGPERVEEHRVGRVVRATQPAPTRGDRRLLVEQVLDSPEHFDRLVAAAGADRNLVRHGQPEVGAALHAVIVDAVWQERIVTFVLRACFLDIVDAGADPPRAERRIESAVVVAEE